MHYCSMSDENDIKKVIDTYIESMNTSSSDMVKEAFHANSKVVGYLHGDFLQMSADEFAGFVASQKPSPKESGTDVEYEILSCEVNGATGIAKVRDKYLGITFLDSLSFVKENDQWKIYNKLFHVEE